MSDAYLVEYLTTWLATASPDQILILRMHLKGMFPFPPMDMPHGITMKDLEAALEKRLKMMEKVWS